nr:coiled coil domain containing protein [Hymenolepis microstoma]
MYMERRQFINDLKKLQNDLEEISQRKNIAIKKSIKAYDEREKLQKKILAISAKGAKERDSFDAEVKERQRSNNYINRLNDFMKIKSKCRYRKPVLPSKGEDPALKYETELNRIEIYEGVFDKLFLILNVKEVSQIIAKFKTNEGEIHRSVEYINNNNVDRSRLKKEIDMHEEQKFQALSHMKTNDDKFRQQILKLDEEYSQASSGKSALSKTVRSTKRIVELVLAGIKQLALLVHCVIDPEEDTDSLVPFSVERVMVAIEDRIGYLHSVYKSRKSVLSVERHTMVDSARDPESLTDSAISEGGTLTRSTDDLPSVGETFDDISVTSGNKSHPIDDAYLRKTII